MIEKPLIHNDEYTYTQDRLLKESLSKRSLSVSQRSLTHRAPNDEVNRSQ